MQPVGVGELERGRVYALYSVRNSDGSPVIFGRIERIGPKWVTLREPTMNGWSAPRRRLRAAWARGTPFLPVEDPTP